jgi:hypothetical protein
MGNKPIAKTIISTYIVFLMGQQTYYRYSFSYREAFLQKALSEDPDSLPIKLLLENEMRARSK